MSRDPRRRLRTALDSAQRWLDAYSTRLVLSLLIIVSVLGGVISTILATRERNPRVDLYPGGC